MKEFKSHFVLLFLKNLKLLIRSPVTLAFEVVVPLMVLFLFFGISQSFSTTHHCFSTYKPKSNALVAPPHVRIAVAPATQRVRDIMEIVAIQNQTKVSPSNFEYLENSERVNTILTSSPTAYVGAVIFDGFQLGDDYFPENISYTIRYPIKTAIGFLDWVGKSPGPDDWKCATGKVGLCIGKKIQCERTFLKEGQFQLQQAIDRAIIHIKTKRPLEDITEVKARQLPFPHWVENWFLVGLSESLSMMIIIGFFWNVFITTKDISKDRDTGVREIFKSIGVNNCSILGSWYCVRLLVAVTVATLVTFSLWAFQLVRFSNMFLVWIIILLFAVSVVNLCFLVGTFISSSTLGMFTILISYLVFYTPFLVLSQNTDQHSDTIKYICSIFSPTTGSLALANVGNWEAEGIGLTWDTLNQCTGPSQFSALSGIIMLIVDSLVYGVLFVYFDEIFPGKHGIGLHWTYIFDKNYWGSITSDKKDDDRNSSCLIGEAQHGIELKGIEKHYFNRGRIVRAVNGLNTHFRANEISTLLGYNGSGKTTTLKMLVAMHSPTKGQIFINGQDLSKHATTIRKTLGYCPQYNILIEDLTVTEHLHLFTSLKGLHGKSRDREIELSIKKLRFEDHRDIAVQYLSGGMKRKLSLGLALCGHPNVVILDEPTCGMDTEARKVTWELLLNHRQGRTIIVSTHDMEEADLLSNRCFVLSEGQIIASGTATTIKTLNSVGYQLSISVEAHVKQFLPVLQQFAPDAKLIRKSYKEQVFSISDADKVSLINLLNHLEVEGPNLGITGHGLMQSDLEEALVNIVKTQSRGQEEVSDKSTKLSRLARLKYYLCGAAEDTETIASAKNLAPVKQSLLPAAGCSAPSDRYIGISLALHRLMTLVKKRILDDARNRHGIVMKFVIPFLLMLFGVIFLKINQRADQKKYTLDVGGLAKLPDHLLTVDLAETNVFNSNNKKLLDFQNIKFQDWTDVIKESVTNDYQNSNCCQYRFLQLENVCAKAIWNSSIWQTCKKYTMFGYYYCFDDCFQRDILLDYQGCSAGQRPGEGSQTQIDFFQNYFLNQSVDYLFKKYHHHVLTSSWEDGDVKLTAWFSAMRRHSIAQTVNVMNNMLLGYYSDNTAGTITTSFWPFQTLEDSLTQAAKVSLPLMIFAMFTTFAATFITASFSLFLVNERVSKMKHLQLMAGISGQVYWYANLLWDYFVFTIFTVLVLLLLVTFSISEFDGDNAVALFFLLMFFAFAALPITHILTMLIDSAVLCFAVICTAGFSLGMCGIMISVYVESAQLHSVLALIPYSSLGIGIVDMYTNRNLQQFSKLCDDCVTGYVDSPFSTESPGVGLQLLCLAIEGSILTVLLVCIEELSVFIQLYYYRDDVRKFVREDSDVSRERRDIRDVAADGYPVVINSISKIFSKHLVLNNVSFGIQKSQCVALLGHNGAGKTTLFSILSGEVIPTFGSVNLFGTSMTSDIRGYRERVGYCPQEPATFTNLTGREVLTLFSGLRGLKKERGDEIVTKLLAWTGLTRYADRITGTYSGGTLRKLSLAISLIGDPPVLLLDEPSASVDPTSRRMLWKLIRQLADSGKSILISTHIKGEVEAVCDKVVVLDKGNAVAIGPCSQIKDKFGSGFCLQVSTSDPTEVDLTKAAIEQRLKNVKFVHRVGRHLQYFVPNSSFSYSDVFIAIELIKQLIKLDHYSVCQLAFTQLDFVNYDSTSSTSNLDSFLKRIHGFVRKSFKRSFTKINDRHLGSMNGEASVAAT